MVWFIIPWHLPVVQECCSFRIGIIQGLGGTHVWWLLPSPEWSEQRGAGSSAGTKRCYRWLCVILHCSLPAPFFPAAVV